MNFRLRLLLAILLAVLVPLGALAFGIRREMDRRLTAEYAERVSAMAEVIESDLVGERGNIDARLNALAADLARDNRFRLAVLGAGSHRQYLLDYASGAMSLSGLSMLQIQDSTGRILSSGHFRNEFDRLQPELPHLLASTESTMALVRTRTPEAELLALVRVDSFRVAGRHYTLVGGIRPEARLLNQPSRGQDLSVALVYPGAANVTSVATRVVGEIALPYLDLLSEPVAVDTSRFVITHSLKTLEALRRSVDRWFLAAVVITGAVALTLAAW
ncbi:MAG TPA: hypothetical protein VJ808_04975, partial [Gemmatimonadales bacterium]|nr:hypothetical protein [Gemmatimonadales bacterium]